MTAHPHDRISVDPQVMLGKPCILGTRITVAHILEQLAGGATVEGLLEAHHRLTREDVQAALAFAAEPVRVERWISPLEEAERRIWEARLEAINAGARSQIDDDQADL